MTALTVFYIVVIIVVSTIKPVNKAIDNREARNMDFDSLLINLKIIKKKQSYSY